MSSLFVAANLNPRYGVFFDTVESWHLHYLSQSPAYLAPGDVFITVGAEGKGISNYAYFVWKVLLQPSFLCGTKRKLKLILVKPDKKDWEAFAKLVEAGTRKCNDWLCVNEDEDSAVVVKRALIAYIRLSLIMYCTVVGI